MRKAAAGRYRIELNRFVVLEVFLNEFRVGNFSEKSLRDLV